MKKTVVMAFLAATIGLCASFAQAQTNSVYAIDSRGEVVMDPFGLCWRTGFWTPAAAAQDKNGCKCDKDLIAKEICEPKAAPVKAEPKKEAPKKAAFGEKVTIAADALFDFNKATLRPEGKAKLDDVVGKSKQLNLEVVIAVGTLTVSVALPTTRNCPRSAPPPSRIIWSPRASRPTVFTPKARAASSR